MFVKYLRPNIVCIYHLISYIFIFVAHSAFDHRSNSASFGGGIVAFEVGGESSRVLRSAIEPHRTCICGRRLCRTQLLPRRSNSSAYRGDRRALHSLSGGEATTIRSCCWRVCRKATSWAAAADNPRHGRNRVAHRTRLAPQRAEEPSSSPGKAPRPRSRC